MCAFPPYILPYEWGKVFIMPEIGVETAHDLRLPLQLIRSSAEMIRLSLEDPTVDAARYVDMLIDSVGQLQSMLDGALRRELRRPPQGRMVHADLPAFLRELCLRCRPWAGQKGVALRCGGNVAALEMALDEDALSRILLNLIANALRFTPSGGHVRVTWRALGDAVEISVADSGAGIAPERLPRIFLRGETDGGFGVGLANARECARALGGELTARSRLGSGSVFTLRLPVRSKQAG